MIPDTFQAILVSLSLSSCRCPLPPSALAAAADPPLTGTHFTATVKHNDSYPGEKLGSILYFIASKRTFFTFPQSEASRNRTINLRKGFHQERWSSQETTLFQAESQRTNKQSVLLRHPPLVTCPQLHLFNIREQGRRRGCDCTSGRPASHTLIQRHQSLGSIPST